MTKQHFARLAKALAAARMATEIDECPITDTAFECFVDQIALACSEHNPKFKYDLFVDACKVRPC